MHVCIACMSKLLANIYVYIPIIHNTKVSVTIHSETVNDNNEYHIKEVTI